MDIPVLCEDDSFLVINKPPGLVVNRAESVKTQTVQDWAESTLSIHPRPSDAGPKTPWVAGTPEQDRERSIVDFYSRAGIVHRIDKETSGILIIAKTIESFIQLQSYFREREIGKTYTAYVHGQLVPSTGEVNVPVGRLPWNKEQFGVVPGGKESFTAYAVTDVRVINPTAMGAGTKFSVVTLHPKTGRTHQIRVHMKYLGHPLLGDYLYAGRKTSRDDRLWAPRVMLHATDIRFPHPVTGVDVVVHAPIPHDMQQLLDTSSIVQP
jgi:23S rRNA pseudouridine1911/1915/1917 synthase